MAWTGTSASQIKTFTDVSEIRFKAHLPRFASSGANALFQSATDRRLEEGVSPASHDALPIKTPVKVSENTKGRTLCSPFCNSGFTSQTVVVASPDTLSQKIARNPLRFGLIVGFLGVPILWMAGENLVRLALHQPVLRAEEFWNYEASGALIGALLGGNGARVWASCRAGQRAEAGGIAIFTGAGGTGFYVLTAALHAATSPFFARDFGLALLELLISRHLPFLLCLLLLLGGLFAPRR